MYSIIENPVNTNYTRSLKLLIIIRKISKENIDFDKLNHSIKKLLKFKTFNI